MTTYTQAPTPVPVQDGAGVTVQLGMRKIGTKHYFYFLPLTSGAVQSPLYRYLDTVGDGSGTKNAVGNYSGAVEEFKIVPEAGEVYRITKLVIAVEDAGAFVAGSYGAGVTLTNGIEIQVTDGITPSLDLTDNVPITSNAMLGQVVTKLELPGFSSGNGWMFATWDFMEAGFPVRLDGGSSEYLAVLLNDDLTGLVSHYFYVEGYIE